MYRRVCRAGKARQPDQRINNTAAMVASMAKWQQLRTKFDDVSECLHGKMVTRG